MPRLFKGTRLLFFLHFALFLSVPFMYWIMVQTAIRINFIHFYDAPLNIFLPGLIIISLGLASAYSKWIVGGIEWYISQVMVVAATVLINNIPYKGSLTAYSFKEVNKSLLVFSTKSIISRKTFKWLQTVKMSLLDKEIMQNIFNHPLLIVRKASGLLRSNMSNTLDFADEILVSYTWITTCIYKEYGPDGNNPKKGKLVRNQAKFFLEGFVHFIRLYPKLVVTTLLPSIGLTILTSMLSLVIVGLAFFVLEINWINALWILFLSQSISAWVERVFVFYAHTLIVLDKFYKALRKSAPIDTGTLVQSVGGIPVFANIARKTGIKEFKGMKFDKTCPSNLLELGAVEELLDMEVKHMCEIFNVDTAL